MVSGAALLDIIVQALVEVAMLAAFSHFLFVVEHNFIHQQLGKPLGAFVHLGISPAGLVRVRRAGNQFHALQRIGGYLGREQFTLLVADGLSVDHKRNLRVISQRMKKTVGIRRDCARAVSDRLAELASGIESR